MLSGAARRTGSRFLSSQNNPTLTSQSRTLIKMYDRTLDTLEHDKFSIKSSIEDFHL